MHLYSSASNDTGHEFDISLIFFNHLMPITSQGNVHLLNNIIILDFKDYCLAVLLNFFWPYFVLLRAVSAVSKTSMVINLVSYAESIVFGCIFKIVLHFREVIACFYFDDLSWTGSVWALTYSERLVSRSTMQVMSFITLTYCKLCY